MLIIFLGDKLYKMANYILLEKKISKYRLLLLIRSNTLKVIFAISFLQNLQNENLISASRKCILVASYFSLIPVSSWLWSTSKITQFDTWQTLKHMLTAHAQMRLACE